MGPLAARMDAQLATPFSHTSRRSVAKAYNGDCARFTIDFDSLATD